MRWILLLMPAVVAAILLGGCSGGDGLGVPSEKPQVARAAFNILWPQRDRLIPNMAESIKVTITDAAGFSAVQTASRPEDGEETSTLTFENLPLSLLTIEVQAYPDPELSSVPVAGNSQQHDALADPDFTITISMISAIDRIEVTPDASALDLGEQAVKVRAVAYDEEDRQVLMSPSKLQWTSSDPAAVAVTRNADGTGQLDARQSTSAPVSLTVLDTESLITASAAVTVNTVQVSANPDTAIVNPTTSLDLSDRLTVTGAVDKSLTWTVEEGGGAVTPAGVYTAPNAHGSYTVTVTSVADATKSATIAVDVPITVSLPATAMLTLNQQLPITATVKGSTQGVNWTLLPGDPGTLTVVDGTHCLYTAPGAFVHNTPVRIIATSVETHNGEAGTATLTITLKTTSGTIFIR